MSICAITADIMPNWSYIRNADIMPNQEDMCNNCGYNMLYDILLGEDTIQKIQI